MEQTFSLFFHGTCEALAQKTLVSKNIRFPFKTKSIRVAFAPGTNRQMRIKIFLAQDPDAPSSGQPTGTNLLAEYGQVDYVIGDDGWRRFEHEVFIPTRNNWLKIYSDNRDIFAHTVDVMITIETQIEEEL